MPVHGMASNRSPLKLEEYHTLAREENITKYSSFPCWCNTCERHSYKQVPNDCVEPCKKKSKETKISSKQYSDNEQYENMELDYQSKDGWYDGKQKQSKKPSRYPCSNRSNDQQYYDCCRIRPNFCELPTSYIRNTNICQPNNTLSGSKMSDNDKEYVECLENRVKSYEKAIKYVEYSENSSVLQEDYVKVRSSYDDRLQRTCRKLEGIQSHYNTIVKSDFTDEYKQTKSNCGHSCSLKVEPNSISDNHSSNLRNVNEENKYCQTEPCVCTDDCRSNHFYNCSIHYETQTYFDKNNQDSKKANFTSLYTQEMETLKEQLKELRKSAYRNSTSAEMVVQSLVDKDREIEEKASNVAKDSPKIVRRPRTKLIRVKTRGRVANTIKVRRSNAKTAISSKTPSIELEDSQR